MKKEISSIELKHIIEEMQFLGHARLDKIIQKEREVFLQFFASGKGNFTLRIVPGRYFYLTGQRAPAHEPHNFVMRLRKYIPFFFLKSLSQIGSERVVRIVLEKNDQEYRVYIELFGRGNVILCDTNDIIIAVLDREKLSDSAQKEVKYIPPQKPINLFELKPEEFRSIKESKQEVLVKALAIEFGIGGVYAEEICTLSGIDKKTSPSELSGKEIERLFSSLQELLSRKIDPQLVFKEGKPVNLTPFPLEVYKGLETKGFPKFNEGLDFVLENYSGEPEHEEAKQQADLKAMKIQRIIDEQEKGLVEVQKTAEDNQKKGEMIYEKYILIKGILDEMNKAREKYDWKEIKERLKGHKVIRSVNEKDKKIVVEV